MNSNCWLSVLFRANHSQRPTISPGVWPLWPNQLLYGCSVIIKNGSIKLLSGWLVLAYQLSLPFFAFFLNSPIMIILVRTWLKIESCDQHVIVHDFSSFIVTHSLSSASWMDQTKGRTPDSILHQVCNNLVPYISE